MAVGKAASACDRAASANTGRALLGEESKDRRRHSAWLHDEEAITNTCYHDLG